MFISSLIVSPNRRSGLKKYLVFAAVFVALLVYFWSDLCLWRAEANMAKRNHVAAANWVERSMWFGSDLDSRKFLLQIRIARRLGDFREVEQKLKLAATYGVPRAEIQRERWLAMAQTNQFDGMQANWNELLQNARDDGPEIARSYYTWAMLHHNHDLALKTLEFWQQDYPRDPEPLILTGKFYQSKVDWEGAERAYRKAFSIAPDNAEVGLALANTLQMRLKTDEAIPLFEAYLKTHPDDLTATRGLSDSLATKGDTEGALRLLQDAIKKHPDDFWLQKACGELLLSSGDAPSAVELLEKAYRSIPENALLAYSLARGLKACGRNAEAEPLFAFVTEAQPQLEEMSKLEKELRDDQDNLDLRMKIAEIVAKFISRRDAVRWYENLLIIAPKYRPAQEELAQLHRSLGDLKQAEFYSNQLEQTP